MSSLILACHRAKIQYNYWYQVHFISCVNKGINKTICSDNVKLFVTFLCSVKLHCTLPVFNTGQTLAQTYMSRENHL